MSQLICTVSSIRRQKKPRSVEPSDLERSVIRPDVIKTRPIRDVLIQANKHLRLLQQTVKCTVANTLEYRMSCSLIWAKLSLANVQVQVSDEWLSTPTGWCAVFPTAGSTCSCCSCSTIRWTNLSRPCVYLALLPSYALFTGSESLNASNTVTFSDFEDHVSCLKPFYLTYIEKCGVYYLRYVYTWIGSFKANVALISTIFSNTKDFLKS